MAFRDLSRNLTALGYTPGVPQQFNVSGMGNKLIFSLNGPTVSGGNLTGLWNDICAAIVNLKIQVASDDGKNYKPYDISGYTAYLISRCFYNTPALRTVTHTGGAITTQNVGFEFCLPIGAHSGKGVTLTISVQWSALTAISAANLTSYAGVLTCEIEQDDTPGKHRFGFLEMPLGNSGVIGVAGTVQPVMPVLEHHKFCGELITYITAGPVLADSLANIRVDEKTGVTILDVTSQIAKVKTQELCFVQPPVGTYFVTHRPIDISTSTQILLTAAVASIAPSTLTYVYLLEGSGVPSGPCVTSKPVAVPAQLQDTKNPGGVLRTPK